MWCTFIQCCWLTKVLTWTQSYLRLTSGRRVFLSARIAARKKASTRFPSSFKSCSSTVSDHANFPYMMHRPSASVARELLTTFSIKFPISTRISLNVLVCQLYSAECNKEENSMLNLISPSLGLDGFGQIILSELCVITFVCPICTQLWPFSTPKRILCFSV